MRALLEAILTKFNATALSSITGGLYFDRVVEGTVRPYARYSVINSPLIAQGYGSVADGWHLQAFDIQFDIWAIGHTTVLNLQDDLQDAFDTAVLTLSPAEGTERHIRTARIRSRSLLEGNDENDDEIYRAITEYRFEVQRAG